MSFPPFSARDAVARHGDEWRPALHAEIAAVAGQFPFQLPFIQLPSAHTVDSQRMGFHSAMSHLARSEGLTLDAETVHLNKAAAGMDWDEWLAFRLEAR